MTSARVQTRGARDGTEDGDGRRQRPRGEDEKSRSSWHQEAQEILRYGPEVSVVEQPSRIPAASSLRRIQPKTKKEDISMNNSKSNKAPSRVEPQYCPACLCDQAKIRRKETDLVCDECNRVFINEAATSLSQGKLLTIYEWIVARVTTHLAILEPKYVSATAEIKQIEEDVVKEASAALDKTIGGAEVLPEVRKQAFQLKRRELWRAKGGDAKYAKKKEAETRIVLLNTVLAKAKAKAADKKAAEETAAAAPVPEMTTAVLVVAES